MGNVRGDDHFSSIGKHKDAVVQGTLSSPQLDFKRANKEERAQREEKRQPQPAAHEISAGPEKTHRRNDPP
jgi:hypothetical protein